MNRDLIRAVWHRHREPLIIPSVVQVPSAEDPHEHFHEGIHAQLQGDARQRLDGEAEAHLPEESPEHAGTRH